MNVVTAKEYLDLLRKVEALKRACEPFALDDETKLVGAQGGDLIVRIPAAAFGEMRRATDSLDTFLRTSRPATPSEPTERQMYDATR